MFEVVGEGSKALPARLLDLKVRSRSPRGSSRRRSAVQVAEVAVLPGVDVALVLGAVRSGDGVLDGGGGDRDGAQAGEVLGHGNLPLADRLNQDLGFPSSLT